MTRRPVPLVIHGPGGVGKDTVVRLLGIRHLVSTTDRPPRPDESDGHDYYFVHSNIFQELIDRGSFLEYAKVLDYWKGLLRREVERAIEAGSSFVIRTDIQGAATWRERMPGCVSVRLLGCDPALPLETHRQDLIARLHQRARDSGHEPDAREVEVRLEELEAEYIATGDHYTVVNPFGDAHGAVARLQEIIRTEAGNTHRPQPRVLDSG